MKKYVFILFLLFPFALFAQYPPLIDTILSRSFQLRAQFRDGAGNYQENHGMGLLINGEYLVTCQHLIYVERPGYKLQKVLLYGNDGNDKENPPYDSIELIQIFKHTKNQYDFSEQKYKKGDYATDIIVFKLKTPLKKGNFNYKKRELNYGDDTYSVGDEFTMIKNIPAVHFKEDHSHFFNYFTQPAPNSKQVFISCIGDAKEGFSGSPLFNSYGEVIGLITSGFEDIPVDFLNQSRKMGLTAKGYNDVINAYKNGKRIFSALNISFIVNNYLKGYLE